MLFFFLPLGGTYNEKGVFNESSKCIIRVGEVKKRARCYRFDRTPPILFVSFQLEFIA